jgi:hypothetical protein
MSAVAANKNRHDDDERIDVKAAQDRAGVTASPLGSYVVVVVEDCGRKA